MLESTEDAVEQPDAVMSGPGDAAKAPDSVAASGGNQAAMARPVTGAEGTLVSAESLNAAYRALGHAALSVVHGNYTDDPVL